MEPGSWTRGIGLFVFAAVAISGATLAMRHRARGHNVAAAAVLTKQSVTRTGSQPERQSEQPESQPSTSAVDDASVFALIAESEVSQLRDGFTLAQWMELYGKNEGWKRTPNKKLEMTDWPRKECLSYVKNETLPSGAKMVRALYFYPPPVPSPTTFPALSGQDLINTCVLAVVRVEAQSPISDFGPALERERRGAEFGHALTEAVRQRFTGRYGESIGMKNVPFWVLALSYTKMLLAGSLMPKSCLVTQPKVSLCLMSTTEQAGFRCALFREAAWKTTHDWAG